MGAFASGGRLYDHSRRPGPSMHPRACSRRASATHASHGQIGRAVASSAPRQPVRATEARVLNVRHARPSSLRGHTTYRAAPPDLLARGWRRSAGARSIRARGSGHAPLEMGRPGRRCVRRRGGRSSSLALKLSGRRREQAASRKNRRSGSAAGLGEPYGVRDAIPALFGYRHFLVHKPPSCTFTTPRWF